MKAKESDENSRTSLLPKNLPQTCDHCSHKFDLRYDLQIGPGKLGRILQKHTLLIAGCSILLFFILGVWLGIDRLEDQNNKAIVILVVVAPTLAVMILRSVLPAKARLYCPGCQYEKFLDLPLNTKKESDPKL